MTGVSGDVRVEDENGSVELHMNKLGSVQLENRKGDIQLYVPDKAGFQVDARSRGGDIETDFDALKMDNRDDQAIATGTVGGGGPRLVVTTSTGRSRFARDRRWRRRRRLRLRHRRPKTPRARPAQPSAPAVTEN